MGSNLNMTRTPDCHFAAEARHNGTQDVGLLARLQPGGASTPTSGSAINAGQDGAWWMAVNHVLLKEFHHERQVPVLPRLLQAQYTDAPFLVELHAATTAHYRPGQLLRAGRLRRVRRASRTATGSS